ncbi:zinc-dependent alcohol dehydrogenase family protein [Jatrophihabitans fulvus]
MRALVVDAFGEAPSVRDVPEPDCPADGMVLRVRATGLCRSDWHGWAGHDPDIVLPHVPGHEYAGEVVAVGPDVRRVGVGDRVTVPFVCACGTCPTCARGAGQVCERQQQPGFSRWGSFAEYVAVPWADVNAVALPDELSFATAAALGCRFATSYRALVAHGRVAAGDRVAVLGCGGVGLSAVMIAASRGAHVVAVDLSDDALALARAFGAASVTTDVASIVHLTDGGADVTVDALGSAALVRAGIAALRPRGRHVQVGLLVGDDASPAVPMSTVIAKELEILGSHGMAAADYPAMLADVAAGRVEPQRLVTSTVGLDDLTGLLPGMSAASPVGIVVAEP